jgi:hypothetical protein
MLSEGTFSGRYNLNISGHQCLRLAHPLEEISSMPLPEEALSSTQDCIFLTRLPLKIRYDIYELLVRAAPHQPDVYATITCLRKFHREGLKHIEDYQPETVLVISRTCRQIRHESFTIYYGSNTFSFSNASFNKSSLYRIYSFKRKSINNITLI